MSSCKFHDYSTTAKFDRYIVFSFFRIMLNIETWPIAKQKGSWDHDFHTWCATGVRSYDKGVAHSALQNLLNYISGISPVLVYGVIWVITQLVDREGCKRLLHEAGLSNFHYSEKYITISSPIRDFLSSKRSSVNENLTSISLIPRPADVQQFSGLNDYETKDADDVRVP